MDLLHNMDLKYKYKDLSDESYIIIEIYSVEVGQENSFLGKLVLQSLVKR